jgi:hypothetical protein
MRLRLRRRISGPFSTIGELEMWDGTAWQHQCFVCEDVVREPLVGHPSPEGKSRADWLREAAAFVATWKKAGQTAIPAGSYKVIVTESARFKRLLPILLEVPGFEGIRIHPGNDAADTEGCLLPGVTEDDGKVWNSRVAFAEVYDLIAAALLAGDSVSIDVQNA